MWFVKIIRCFFRGGFLWQSEIHQCQVSKLLVLICHKKRYVCSFYSAEVAIIVDRNPLELETVLTTFIT